MRIGRNGDLCRFSLGRKAGLGETFLKVFVRSQKSATLIVLQGRASFYQLFIVCHHSPPHEPGHFVYDQIETAHCSVFQQRVNPTLAPLVCPISADRECSR